MDHFITYYNIDCPPGSVSAVLEDSIMHKGRPVTAGSKALENFIAPLSATVAERLESAGVIILGKTKMDELGAAGLFPDTSPSESGAVSAVADGTAAFALCNDYTGALRRQAAAQGICCIRPTYGTVSRYGLIPSVPSMDQIGVLCKTPEEGFRALSLIAGHDPKDGAMFGRGEPGEGRGERREERGETPKGAGRSDGSDEQYTCNVQMGAVRTERIRLGIPLNTLEGAADKAAVAEYAKDFDTLEFELKYFDVFAQVMRILCCAELSACISRYDGIKYGYRTGSFGDLHELYTKSRTEAFGGDTKLAAIMGCMTLSREYYARYYDKAMRIRRLIRDALEFDKYDAIIMPASASTHDGQLALGALPQLCGLPSVTLPFSGGGITLIADTARENVLFNHLRKVCL